MVLRLTTFAFINLAITHGFSLLLLFDFRALKDPNKCSAPQIMQSITPQLDTLNTPWFRDYLPRRPGIKLPGMVFFFFLFYVYMQPVGL